MHKMAYFYKSGCTIIFILHMNMYIQYFHYVTAVTIIAAYLEDNGKG